MTLSAVAARYANALADVVTAGSALISPQQAVAELRSFGSALETSPELREALATPAVPSSRKKAVIGRIADVLGISRVARNFLFVLVDHRRIASLAEIVQRFEEVLDERLGFAHADVSTATRLEEEQRAALGRQLERLTGKRIRARYAVDPALIGGVVARIGSTVYDGSVRGQLATLGRRLAAEE
jgi:F-type H+-transporting ATPase subunit delta